MKGWTQNEYVDFDFHHAHDMNCSEMIQTLLMLRRAGKKILTSPGSWPAYSKSCWPTRWRSSCRWPCYQVAPTRRVTLG